MKKIILLLVLAAMSGGGYYYWHNNHTKTSKDESRTRYVEIERDSIAEVVATTGGVDPNLEVEIKCRAGGQIIRLPYDVSDRVTSGSLLMELDPIDESRRVRQSEVELQSSLARLEQSKRQLTVAERTLATAQQQAAADLKSAEARARESRAKADRVMQLFEKKLASQEEYDAALTAAVQAESALENARARIEEIKTQEMAIELKRQDVKLSEAEVEKDKIALSLSQQQLLYTKVYAPMDGVVSARNVQIGQMIASAMTNVGGGTAIMTLADLSQMFVMASVDESDIGKVKVGQSTSITCDAHPGEFFTGKVARIAAKGKTVSNVVTFEVKIEVVSKNKELLKPEMTTNVEIIVAEREDALLVPTEAIVRRLRGQPTVVVLNDDGTTESRAIETGMTDGFRTEVASGVEEGETVVVRRGEGEGRWRGRGGMTGSGGPSSMGGSSRGGPPMMFGGGGPPRR